MTDAIKPPSEVEQAFDIFMNAFDPAYVGEKDDNHALGVGIQAGLKAVLATLTANAPVGEPVAVPTDDDILSVCRVMKPNIFARGLAPLPGDGPATRATIEKTKAEARKLLASITRPPVAVGADEIARDNLVRLSASERACYLWPEDNAEHRALRSAFMEGASSFAAGSK